MSNNLNKLPHRVIGNYTKQFPKVNIITNFFQIQVNFKSLIYIYKIKIIPQVHQGCRNLIQKLMVQAKPIIQKIIGKHIVNGTTIFSPQNYEEVLTITLTKHVLEIKQVKKIEFSNLASNNFNERSLPIMFLNNLFKACLRQLHFIEIGKTRKFFQYNQFDNIQGMRVYDGYLSSIALLEGGLYLKLDPCSKVIGNESCLKILNKLYTQNQQKSRQEKRKIVYQHFVGKTVMSNYGQGHSYVIQDIIYDKNLQTLIIQGNQQNLTLKQYYLQKYNIKILKLTQPLFQAKSKKLKNSNKSTLLVPQLMLMNALMSQIDQKIRVQISKLTIKSPQQKFNQVKDLINKIHQNGGLTELKQALNIRIDQTPKQLEVCKLEPPILSLGNNKRIQQRKINSFALFDQELYQTTRDLNVQIINLQNFDASQMINLFKQTCSKFKINFKSKNKILEKKLQINLLDQILNCLNQSKYDIILVVLPSSNKSYYDRIKRVGMTQKGLMTQVVLDKTLQKKGFQSICTKILLQMIHKNGSNLWLVKSPTFKIESPMLISIDSSKCKYVKGKQAVAIVSSLNGAFSKFHYMYDVKQKKELTFGTSIQNYLKLSLNAYYESNNRFPSDIIILRDGISQQQARLITQAEIEALRKYIKQIKNEDLKLSYISVERRVSQRFYQRVGPNIVNARSGIYVHQDVVQQGYNFYLIGQQCNRGTVSPTRFRVLFNDSLIEQGHLAHLLYTQCFNFQNWTGSVRIPASSVYAKKLSTFISTYIHTNQEKKILECLNKNPYFI